MSFNTLLWMNLYRVSSFYDLSLPNDTTLDSQLLFLRTTHRFVNLLQHLDAKLYKEFGKIDVIQRWGLYDTSAMSSDLRSPLFERKSNFGVFGQSGWYLETLPVAHSTEADPFIVFSFLIFGYLRKSQPLRAHLIIIITDVLPHRYHIRCPLIKCIYKRELDICYQE